MLPLVLGELVRRAKSLWASPTGQWLPCEPTREELAAAEREATTGAQFDRLALKKTVWEGYEQGAVKLVCKKLGGLARVLVFLPKGVNEPNWALWARVFEWFGPSPDKRPWCVTYFAAQRKREFPEAGQDLAAEHVNGGYTTPCSTEGIFIYRYEEATRVLVHEMMHAACLDEHGWTIPHTEAMVETWAELILIALLSKGGNLAAKRLWVAQSHWIADTNWKARHENNTHDMSDYAWRYLVGREEMYAKLGIALPAARPVHARRAASLRFTHPMLEA
jgi:hypothetical protein